MTETFNNNSMNSDKGQPAQAVVLTDQTATNDENEEINIRDFLVTCLAKWRWFVVSILIFLSLGVLYLLITPKTYTRTASVMITDEKDSKQSAMAALSDIGLFQSSSNVNNEMLAFGSPAIIGEVIAKLNLENEYTHRSGLRNVTLYGDSLPITVHYLTLPPSMSSSMKVRLLGKGKVEITDMTVGNEDCEKESLTVNLGDTVSTEAGDIVINPGPDYKADFDSPINVTHYSMPTAIDIYKAKLTETLVDEKASVIEFTFKDVSIARADDFLNTLINIYNEKWVDDKARQAKKTSEFIEERLQVIERELGNVDSDIAQYKGENLVPDVEAASTMYMEKSNENTKLQFEISTQIAISKYLLEHIKDPAVHGQLLPANSGIDNRGIESQIQEYNAIQLERDKLANTSGENNPIMQDYDKSLRSMRSALVQSLVNQERSLEIQLNSLIRDDRATNSKIASSPTQAKYLLSVERQQKVKEALYLYLLQKREENELTLAYTPFNTRIITPPMGSNKPSSPISRNIIAICFALGLIVPAGLLFIDASSNTYLRSRSDIKGVKTPLLGELPEASNKSGSQRMRRLKRHWRKLTGKSETASEAPALLVYEHGQSIINEAFRMLRSNLEFMTRNGRNRVIMVTSFNPGSGKSFISLNLAATLALKDKERKVLVIDLDLRRASVSRTVPHSRGIADYLSEATDNCDKYIQPTQCPGLHVLPVGTIPPNPTELLYSDRLKNLIDKYRLEYDYIFLDCPPAEIVADASIITPLADMTVFVIRAGLLDRRMIPEIDRIYNSHRYNNFMLILNGTSSTVTPYRKYSYGSYYKSEK
ncbi:MAG: polysaccharide biosynthesis tyrosine autokinase [Bacteroides sp.]|nr:polysaccharide biosynthesis tyrosine autokinase [Bacteroides sp.]